MPNVKVAGSSYNGSGGSYLPLAGGTLTGQLLLPTGSLAAPAIEFAGAGVPGFYSLGGKLMVCVNNNTDAAYANGYGWFAGQTRYLGWDQRTWLSSPANGKVKITDNTGANGVTLNASGNAWLLRNLADSDYAAMTAGNVSATGTGGVRTIVGPIEARYGASQGGGHVMDSATVVSTSDATPTDLWVSPVIAEGEAMVVHAEVVGFDATNAGGYILHGVVKRVSAGNVALVGTPSVPHDYEDDATWGGASLVVDTSAQTAKIQVTGKAATNIVWRAAVHYQKTAAS